MKKILFLLNFIFCFGLYAGAEEVEYHFQEGFETKRPTGWTRTCGATEALNHIGDPPLSFTGIYAMKFDASCVDESFYLETLEYSDAGILSFYISRNANNTLMDLHVYKIVDGVSTKIKDIDANLVSHKNNGWDYIPIVVNETGKVKFRFTCTIRDGNGGWFAIDDMELTKYSDSEPPVNPDVVEKVNTDFGDGTWGEVLEKNPASGEYPTQNTYNGFVINKGVLARISATCPTGAKHTNRFVLDKNSQGGSIELPALKDVGELEIHAATGSVGMSFKVQEMIGNNWTDIGTYVTRQSPDSVYVIPLNRETETKIRIANNTGSILLVYQIISRTCKETRELNATSFTPAEGSTCYFNLTKNVTVTFNKEIVMGTGNIDLNGVQIPVTSCTINGKTVSIPVELESTKSGKSYTLSVPQGAFLEKGNETNISNAAMLNFLTFKLVSTPDDYTSVIDAIYSTSDVSMNRMDIYYPTNPKNGPVPVVINVHGGGWNHGEKEAQTGFSVFFNMGLAVANLEYRMTPQATAPAAVVDMRCALMYLLKHADELNIDVNKVVFQGGSAGGHLALTAAYLQKDKTYDIGCNDYTGDYKIVAVIDKYGPSDVTRFLHYKSLVNWLGEYAEDTDFMKTISPCHLVNADTPPTYIIHGDADPIVEYEQSEFLVEALTAAGVRHQFTTVPGGGHGGFPTEYNTLMSEEITAFLTDILWGATSVDPNEIDETSNLINIEGDTIRVNAEGNSSIEIFDISGKKVLNSKDKEVTLTQSGVFVVKVNAGTQNSVSKIIK